MSRTRSNLVAGRALRDKGTRQVVMRDPAFHLHAMDVIRAVASERMVFTSDQVVDRLEVQPFHRNSIGAALHAAVKRGIITRVGYEQSKRPEAHARVVALYQAVAHA